MTALDTNVYIYVSDNWNRAGKRLHWISLPGDERNRRGKSKSRLLISSCRPLTRTLHVAVRRKVPRIQDVAAVLTER